MTKTKLLLAAGMALASLMSAAQAQAATREVDIGMETFANRCIDQGGVFAADMPVLTCLVASVQVDCTFLDTHYAECSWPGIDNRVAVNRLIGMADASTLSGGGGSAGGKGGGIDLPDFPIKWK